MKNKNILIGIIVLVLLYYLLKQYTTQVSSSIIGQPASKSTTTASSNPLNNFINSLFGKASTSNAQSGNAAPQPTLQQVGILKKPSFDFSYCGVSQNVLNSGAIVNWCIDAATGDNYSLDQFPSANVPFKILSDPNQIKLSEDMNGLTSNAYNNDSTASNTPMPGMQPVVNSDGSITYV